MKTKIRMNKMTVTGQEGVIERLREKAAASGQDRAKFVQIVTDALATLEYRRTLVQRVALACWERENANCMAEAYNVDGLPEERELLRSYAGVLYLTEDQEICLKRQVRSRMGGVMN